MNKITTLAAFTLTSALALQGCSDVPVQNFRNSPIHMNKAYPSLSEVEVAIIRGGTNAGWQMRVVKPGQINAKLFEDKHMAEVTISFSTTLYNINYLNSENLDFTSKAGKPDEIYEDYNVWVQDLDKSIRKELIAKSQ